MNGPRPATYGEFPSLFEGFPPDEPVDVSDPRTQWTIFARADRVARELLIPRDSPRYDPEEARRESWRLVQRLGRGDAGPTGGPRP